MTARSGANSMRSPGRGGRETRSSPEARAFVQPDTGSVAGLRSATGVKSRNSAAPPVGRWDFSAALAPPCPWLVVQGEDDDVVDPQAVYDWIDAMEDKPALVRMPETGHFFHRRMMDLRGAIKNGVRTNLPPPISA